MEVQNTINDTNFVINIKFKDNVNSTVISEFESIKLIDEKNGNEISEFSLDSKDKSQNITLKIDYGKYNLSNNLKLDIRYDYRKETTIKFYK